METQWQRALVVGASSGIGECIARQLAAQGSTVALVARRRDTLERIAAEINRQGAGQALVFPSDVREPENVAACFQEITTALGGLDLAVYAAGIMPRVGPGEFPTADDIATVETNVTGAIAWLNAAAERFRAAGSGTIIGISSVAGDRGRVGNPVYNASKAALNTYLEALRNRLARHGVRVVTAKPGYVRTPMIEGIPLPRLFPVLTPDEAARLILEAAASGKRVAYIPPWWQLIMLVVRAVPAPLFERLNV